jgi:hypothetical protein
MAQIGFVRRDNAPTPVRHRTMRARWRNGSALF